MILGKQYPLVSVKTLGVLPFQYGGAAYLKGNRADIVPYSSVLSQFLFYPGEFLVREGACANGFNYTAVDHRHIYW